MGLCYNKDNREKGREKDTLDCRKVIKQKSNIID